VNGKDAPILRIENEADFDDFVADLRSAARRSKKHGGAYSVYRKGANGQTLVRIEIQFPIGRDHA